MFKKEFPVETSVEVNGDGAKNITISTGCIDLSDPNALQKLKEMREQLKTGELKTTVTITGENPISVTTQTIFKANGQPSTRIATSATPETSKTNDQKYILKDLAKYYKQFKSRGESWDSFKDKTYNEQLFLQAITRGTSTSPDLLKAVLKSINIGLKENDPNAEEASQLFDLFLQDGSLNKIVIKTFDSEYMLEMLKRQPLKDGLNNILHSYELTQERIRALLKDDIFSTKPESSKNEHSLRLF